MKALFKTLFGDRRNIAVVAVAFAVSFALLHSPLAGFAGFVLPALLLAGCAYLARP